MPIKKEIILYQYSELSDNAKEKARDWFREGNMHDNFWSECVEEDAKTCAALVGIQIKKLYWSGFSSQGSGAMFTGRWDASEVKPGALSAHVGKSDAELCRLAFIFESCAEEYPEGYLTVEHAGRYYHSNSTDFDVCLEEQDADKGDRDAIVQACRDFMDWIYDSLQREHEYQNSDAVVAENIEANEYTFFGNGTRSLPLLQGGFLTITIS